MKVVRDALVVEFGAVTDIYLIYLYITRVKMGL